MPSGSFLQVDVICPFYQTDNGKNTLTCEGVIPGSRTVSVFQKHADFLCQVKTFCQCRYENCEVYRAIQALYDED